MYVHRLAFQFHQETHAVVLRMRYMRSVRSPRAQRCRKQRTLSCSVSFFRFLEIVETKKSAAYEKQMFCVAKTPWVSNGMGKGLLGEAFHVLKNDAEFISTCEIRRYIKEKVCARENHDLAQHHAQRRSQTPLKFNHAGRQKGSHAVYPQPPYLGC